MPSESKKRARINCIGHMLSMIPYEQVEFAKPKLGRRQKRPADFVDETFVRNVVPDIF